MLSLLIFLAMKQAEAGLDKNPACKAVALAAQNGKPHAAMVYARYDKTKFVCVSATGVSLYVAQDKALAKCIALAKPHGASANCRVLGSASH